MSEVPFTVDSKFLEDIHEAALRYARKKYSFWASDEECKVMVQKAMFTLFNKVHNGTFTELTCNLKTYVIGILKNIAKNQASKQSKQFSPQIEQEEDVLDHIEIAMIPVILERWQAKENDEFHEQLQEEVRQLVENMKEPCRSILWAFYWEGKSMTEIANENGYTGKDVAKSQKSRCMTKVKTAMEDIYQQLRL